MCDSDVETPPLKSRKVTMANHATLARRTKSDKHKQRTLQARKTKNLKTNNNSLAQARQAKLNKQQHTKQVNQSRQNQNHNCQCARNIANDLTTLLDQIHQKLQEYAELDEIDDKIMYVDIA